jgi:hypothetical protein
MPRPGKSVPSYRGPLSMISLDLNEGEQTLTPSGVTFSRRAYFLAALGSPVGGGAWSSLAGGPSSSMNCGFRASAQTW